MVFEKVKHIRLLHALLAFIRMILFPVLPIVFVIYQYELYEKIHVDKYQLTFLVLSVVVVVYLLKYIISTVKMKDAFTDGQQMVRYIVQAVLQSLKWIVVFIALIIISKDINSIDITKIENVRMFIGSVLLFIGFKLLDTWYYALLIQPVEFVMENRMLAYRKACIDQQSEFINK